MIFFRFLSSARSHAISSQSGCSFTFASHKNAPNCQHTWKSTRKYVPRCFSSSTNTARRKYSTKLVFNYTHESSTFSDTNYLISLLIYFKSTIACCMMHITYLCIQWILAMWKLKNDEFQENNENGSFWNMNSIQILIATFDTIETFILIYLYV